MALNPNHSFDDLDGIKCAIVEKNCSAERVEFLKKVLEHNKFTVVVANTPPPKAAAPKPAPKPAAPTEEGAPAPPPAEPAAPPPPPAPTTFTVGVTDVSFSPTNAVFNRELKTLGGKVVTSAYWKQLELEPQPDEWYWKK